MTRQRFLDALIERIRREVFTGPPHVAITPEELIGAGEVFESLVDAEATRFDLRDRDEDDGRSYGDPRFERDERRGL